MPCPRCDGCGRIEHEDGVSQPLICPSCEGAGMVEIEDDIDDIAHGGSPHETAED